MKLHSYYLSKRDLACEAGLWGIIDVMGDILYFLYMIMMSGKDEWKRNISRLVSY
jgi:hypothetical protein